MLQEESLAHHGGASGLRDEGLLESALDRPRNLFAYGTPTLYALAASYAFGLARNHPFVDGNKRTAFLVAVAVLEINGKRFFASEADAAVRTLALAAGNLSEAAYAEWMKENAR